jgi:hypothetical protein
LSFVFTFERADLDVARLQSSLEELLDGDFWPLRGILRGMQIEVAEPFPPYFQLTDRADLSMDDVRQDPALSSGLTQAALGQETPVLCVRLTVLQDGFLLGLNISHSYADAHTLLRLFWPAWASRYSGRDFPYQILNDRSPLTAGAPEAAAAGLVHPHMIVIPIAALPPPPALPLRPEKTAGGPSASMRGLLHLSDSTLQSLQQQAGCATRLKAVYTIAWKALGTRQLAFPCNVRESEPRWSPALPYGYTGNGIFLHGCFCDDIQTASLSELAAHYQAAVDGCTTEKNRELLAKLATVVSPTGGSFITVPMGLQCLAITSWTRSELCPVFGVGRPRAHWSAPHAYPHLLAITDGEPDGFDVHGHHEDIAKIRAFVDALLAHA